MSKVYFISDVHLGLGSREEERKKEQRLLDFLDHIKEDARELFIVGDLFDAWIEYRTVIPKGFHRVLAKLDEIVSRGIIVHYLAGNHDYWMRDYFWEEMGIKTYSTAFDTCVDGKKIFIHHGDGLSGNDAGYKLLKIVLRNRFSVWLFSWIHPDIGLALARASSKKSRGHTSGKSYGEEDGMERLAKARIDEGYDIAMMGHRHQPVCKELGKGLYINLGDWITHDTYAEIENGRVELKVWRS